MSRSVKAPYTAVKLDAGGLLQNHIADRDDAHAMYMLVTEIVAENGAHEKPFRRPIGEHFCRSLCG